MSRTAKLFRNGRSQAVRLPSAYRFEGSEVYVRRDPSTGDVVLVAQARVLGRIFRVAEDDRCAGRLSLGSG